MGTREKEGFLLANCVELFRIWLIGRTVRVELDPRSEVIAIRGFGRIDMFPGDDVGARNKLQALLGRSEQFTYARIKEITSHWHPYAGFVYFHLLLGQLERQGLLREKEGRGIDVL